MEIFSVVILKESKTLVVVPIGWISFNTTQKAEIFMTGLCRFEDRLIFVGPDIGQAPVFDLPISREFTPSANANYIGRVLKTFRMVGQALEYKDHHRRILPICYAESVLFDEAFHTLATTDIDAATPHRRLIQITITETARIAHHVGQPTNDHLTAGAQSNSHLNTPGGSGKNHNIQEKPDEVAASGSNNRSERANELSHDDQLNQGYDDDHAIALQQHVDIQEQPDGVAGGGSNNRSEHATQLSHDGQSNQSYVDDRVDEGMRSVIHNIEDKIDAPRGVRNIEEVLPDKMEDEAEIVDIYRMNQISGIFSSNDFVIPIIVKSEIKTNPNFPAVKYIDGEYEVEMFFRTNGFARPISVKTDQSLSEITDDVVSGDLMFTPMPDGREYHINGMRITIANFIFDQLQILNRDKNTEDEDVQFLTILIVYCVRGELGDLDKGSWVPNVRKLIQKLYEQRTKDHQCRRARFGFLVKIAWQNALKVVAKLADQYSNV